MYRSCKRKLLQLSAICKARRTKYPKRVTRIEPSLPNSDSTTLIYTTWYVHILLNTIVEEHTSDGWYLLLQNEYAVQQEADAEQALHDVESRMGNLKSQCVTNKRQLAEKERQMKVWSQALHL